MPAYVPLEQRFWYHVTPNDGSCWEWTGSINNKGYGRIGINQTVFLAHRVAYQMCIGDIPFGACLIHSCDNTKCVNPFHLRVGSQKDNMADMTAKGRARHPSMRPDPRYCRAMKHEWVPENVKVWVRKDRGGVTERSCLLCEKEAKARRVESMRAYSPDLGKPVSRGTR